MTVSTDIRKLIVQEGIKGSSINMLQYIKPYIKHLNMSIFLWAWYRSAKPDQPSDAKIETMVDKFMYPKFLTGIFQISTMYFVWNRSGAYMKQEQRKNRAFGTSIYSSHNDFFITLLAHRGYPKIPIKRFFKRKKVKIQKKTPLKDE
jgi:hypothetical protein